MVLSCNHSPSCDMAGHSQALQASDHLSLSVSVRVVWYLLLKISLPHLGRVAIRGFWAHLWWCCALCAAPPAARRSGGRHSRGAKRFSGTLTRTTAAAFNSPSGALGPRARSANSCALRRVTTPGPVVGGTTSRPARMRGRWTDSSSSRARALLTAARALQQECRKPQCGIVRLPHRAAAAPLLLGHHRELGGPLRGRGQHRAGSLLRAGADRGCGLKALPADLWPGACQTAGPNTPALARATAPGAGWDISS